MNREDEEAAIAAFEAAGRVTKLPPVEDPFRRLLERREQAAHRREGNAAKDTIFTFGRPSRGRHRGRPRKSPTPEGEPAYHDDRSE